MKDRLVVCYVYHSERCLKKQDREGAIDTEIFSQVDILYRSSGCMTFSATQESERLVQIEDQGVGEDGFRIYTNEHVDEHGEEVVSDLHCSQDSGHRGTPAPQATGNLCTKYNAKELSSLVDAHAFIKDEKSSIPIVVDLSDQLPEIKKMCLAHTEQLETEAVC